MEGLISRLSPRWALRRQVARMQLERLYKAAQPSSRRSNPTDPRDGNAVMDHARLRLSQWGRHLDENNDLVHSMLDVASLQASHVTIEPTVRDRSGALVEAVNDSLRASWLKYRDSLDSAGGVPWCVLSGLAARTWLRDGEVFGQHLLGANIAYPTDVPYAIELHEPDMVPYDFSVAGRQGSARVVHGIEVSRLGRPLAYHVYSDHPGESVSVADFSTRTIRIPAAQVSHLKNVERLHQYRGASALAPAITRLADVRDYEESEQMAAKLAASLCAVITRSPDWVGSASVDAQSGQRPFELEPGVVFDGMQPGEGVQVIGTERPNTGLADYRQAMLRAACAGFGVSYSAATHDYDGTYSSQRQELVEMQIRYSALREQYRAMFLRPVWTRFVQALQLAGLVRPGRADPSTLFDFEAIAPPTPWIDPARESSADASAIAARTESRHGIIRKRGGDPRRIDAEIEGDPYASQVSPGPDASGDSGSETEVSEIESA